MQKTVEISYEEGEGADKIEFKGTAIIKRLSFSERNDYEEQSIEIKVVGTVQTTKVSSSKMKELGILKSVASSNVKRITYFEDRVTKAFIPKEEAYPLNDITNIRNLPIDLGEQLFSEFQELNSLSEKKSVK